MDPYNYVSHLHTTPLENQLYVYVILSVHPFPCIGQRLGSIIHDSHEQILSYFMCVWWFFTVNVCFKWNVMGRCSGPWSLKPNQKVPGPWNLNWKSPWSLKPKLKKSLVPKTKNAKVPRSLKPHSGSQHLFSLYLNAKCL